MSDSKINTDLQDKDPQMSKEELSQRREEITAFYKDNIPHLEVQADYETLLAAIEKARAERMQAQMFMAQQYASQKGEGIFSYFHHPPITPRAAGDCVWFDAHPSLTLSMLNTEKYPVTQHKLICKLLT